MVEVERAARDAIRREVRERGWSVSECAERLTAVGLSTSRASVHRFLTGDARRLPLDEWAAWALALSVPPADLLVPVSESHGRDERARTRAVREWLAGREPVPDVAEPDRYRAAVLGHDANPSEYASALRQLADAFDVAGSAEDRAGVLMTTDGLVMGTLRAMLRQDVHGRRNDGPAYPRRAGDTTEGV